MAILYGMARPTLTTVIGGQERLLTFEPMSFQLATNTDTVKSTKFNTEGQIVTAGTAARAIETVLTVGVEAINWMSIQLAHGELSSVSTGLEIPTLKFANLPLTGAQTIADTIIPATAVKVSAAVYTDAKAMSLTRVSGTPGAGQFSVAAGMITVGPGNEGATIGYRVIETIATCDSIGVAEAPTLFSKMRFDGVLTTDDKLSVYKIAIPELSRETEPSISIESPTKFELQYTLITAPGKRRPYDLYRIPV